MPESHTAQTTLRGTVQWFDAGRGYGFLKRDDGEPDIFVHYTGITAHGYRQLLPDQRVKFVVVAGEKGPIATNVRVVED